MGATVGIPLCDKERVNLRRLSLSESGELLLSVVEFRVSGVGVRQLGAYFDTV